jgi:hypothetical protein
MSLSKIVNVSKALKDMKKFKDYRNHVPFYIDLTKDENINLASNYLVNPESRKRKYPMPFEKCLFLILQDHNYYFLAVDHIKEGFEKALSVRLIQILDQTEEEFNDDIHRVVPFERFSIIYNDGLWGDTIRSFESDFQGENGVTERIRNQDNFLEMVVPIKDEAIKGMKLVLYAVSFLLSNKVSTRISTGKNKRIPENSNLTPFKQKDNDYYIVNVSKETYEESAVKGTHASPITHQRRSHIRRYKNGTEVVVSSSIINEGKNALPTQEYRV